MIRKIIIRAIVFIAVAISSAFFFNKLNNLGIDKISKEMDEPTLPIVYCELGDKMVNRMFGYTQVMSTSLMRDSIIPLNEDYGVNLFVRDDDEFGSSYSYELRSIAGNSLIEDGEAELVMTKPEYNEYSVKFRMDMEMNKEYVLVFIVTSEDGKSARYYTRIVNLEKQFARNIIDYAQEFHATTLIKEVNESEGNLVFNELKPTPEGSDYDLSYVNLNSSYDMISWGGMKMITVTPIVPEITEVDKEYSVVHFGYMAETVSDSVCHYYNVDEYYTARYNESSEKVELLAFDRYVDSLFDKDYIDKDKNCISLGIADKNNISYELSPNGRKIVFEKDGELWCYDYDNQTLISVFSFMQGNYSDIRITNNNLGINIANVDDEGNIYFVVYGYMNRGKHEGENGISLYLYDAKTSKIEEMYFANCDETYDIMKSEVGRFVYYDEAGYLYFLVDSSIYKVDIQNNTQDTLVYGITSDKYLVSDNKKIIAYPNNDVPEEVTGIVIKNFETGEEYQKNGSSSDRFLGLGFVNNDLIYGVSKKDDIIISTTGEAILPLNKIYISDSTGNVLKEYSKSGIYTMNATVNTDKIFLKRAVKKNKFFEETDADFISYKKDFDEKEFRIENDYDTYDYTTYGITFPSNMYVSTNLEPIMTKFKKDKELKSYKIETTTSSNAYYVFENSGFAGEYQSAGSAIAKVNEAKNGLVVDFNGNTIYRNIEATSFNTVADSIKEVKCKKAKKSLMTCAYMCINYMGETPELKDVLACESWEAAFEQFTDGVGMNISGVDLDTALYFLDRDIPFAARIEKGQYVLVISYNDTHVRYFDPTKNEEIKVKRKTFSDKMSKFGNTMYTFTEQ